MKRPALAMIAVNPTAFRDAVLPPAQHNLHISDATGQDTTQPGTCYLISHQFTSAASTALSASIPFTAESRKQARLAFS